MKSRPVLPSASGAADTPPSLATHHATMHVIASDSTRAAPAASAAPPSPPPPVAMASGVALQRSVALALPRLRLRLPRVSQAAGARHARCTPGAASSNGSRRTAAAPALGHAGELLQAQSAFGCRLAVGWRSGEALQHKRLSAGRDRASGFACGPSIEWKHTRGHFKIASEAESAPIRAHWSDLQSPALSRPRPVSSPQSPAAPRTGRVTAPSPACVTPAAPSAAPTGSEAPRRKGAAAREAQRSAARSS